MTMTGSAPLRARDAAARRRRRNVHAVASGKGGVGKTWIAITLAQALAKSGRRTLLFDGDLGLANVDIQLGLAPAQDLGAVIAGKVALSDAILPCPAGGFDMIAGRSGSGSLASISGGRLEAMLSELDAVAAGYDRVILDLGAGVERTVRALAATAESCIVVTTDEPTSLTDAYAFIKVTAARNSGAKFQIVVNMAASTRAGEHTYQTLLKACEGFLKISPRLLGVVRRDRSVKDTIRAQMPLLTRHPNSDAAQDVAAIAAKLGG